jgi:hypothetical protein
LIAIESVLSAEATLRPIAGPKLLGFGQIISASGLSLPAKLLRAVAEERLGLLLGIEVLVDFPQRPLGFRARLAKSCSQRIWGFGLVLILWLAGKKENLLGWNLGSGFWTASR